MSNEVVWAWIHGPGLDQPVERIAFINGEARTRQVVHADGLGSVAALTDESGASVQTYAYAAFGGIREQTGTDLNRVTFTAREALGDSLRFYYYRHRVYDPNTGRFTSEDPLGFIDGVNRYVYVGNNPINGIDPLGLRMRFIYGSGHAWVEITDSPYAGTYGYGATQAAYLNWGRHPVLGLPGAVFNKGQLYHPDIFQSKYTQDDVCERDTTPEQEKKLVDEMQNWVDENSYIGWLNDCYDFTEHFQQRATDLIQVDQVKQGQMGLWQHLGSRLGRHLTPNRHNIF